MQRLPRASGLSGWHLKGLTHPRTERAPCLTRALGGFSGTDFPGQGTSDRCLPTPAPGLGLRARERGCEPGGPRGGEEGTGSRPSSHPAPGGSPAESLCVIPSEIQEGRRADPLCQEGPASCGGAQPRVGSPLLLLAADGGRRRRPLPPEPTALPGAVEAAVERPGA